MAKAPAFKSAKETDQFAGKQAETAAPAAPAEQVPLNQQPAFDDAATQIAQAPATGPAQATTQTTNLAVQQMQQAAGNAARPTQFIIARGLTQQQLSKLNDTLCEQNGGRVLNYQCV